MAVSKRLPAVALVVVALALTVTGVVLAATDPNPSARPKDPFVLNGYPPKHADLQVVISSGQAYRVTANVVMDFRNNTVDAQLQIPFMFSATSVDLRLVRSRLYVGASNLSSIVGSPWISVPMKQPSLFGLSLEMTKPDISLIRGFDQETITHNGYATTYNFRRKNVILSTPSALPIKMPSGATVDLSITVGSQGEVTAASLSERSKTSTLLISATVLSYNQPANIAAPPAKDVKPERSSTLRQILGSSPLATLLSPQDLANIGKIQLS
jgi:hypothetical protein